MHCVYLWNNQSINQSNVRLNWIQTKKKRHTHTSNIEWIYEDYYPYHAIEIKDRKYKSNWLCIDINYYHDNQHLSFAEREGLNYDHPKAIDFELLTEHIRKLKNGESIEQPVYSFVTHSRTGDKVRIEPKKVLIVEGILVLTNKELLKEFGLKIFVHADADERLIRRIRRDIQERGRDLEEVLHRYRTTLKPMHQEFIEPSKNEADIIIPNMKFENGAYNTAAIDMLSTVINETLKQYSK